MAAKPKERRNRERREKYAQDKALEKLALFEEFSETILPQLQSFLKDGKSADDIFKAFEPMAAARIVTEAVTSTNPSVALAAAKEIREHASGKAVARQETTHKFENLKDEELDAILMSKLSEAVEDSDEALRSH